MNGLLVRVGIDSTYGQWNGPVCARTLSFAYVPIPEGRTLRPGYERLYREFAVAALRAGRALPESLFDTPTHLDPDFEYLTFGDQGQRGRRIASLEPGDLLAFYAGLRSLDEQGASLVYALIGLFVVDSIMKASAVERSRWHENAHTRRLECESDVIVRARPKVSGRLKRCIPIGEYRERAYRVTRPLLAAWGGLDVENGYIHRSAYLPGFNDTERFYAWFLAQAPELVAANNLDAAA